MGDRDLITALKQNKLHIDCVNMELTQNATDNPKRFTGSGYVFQDDQGIISFKLYVNQYDNTSQADVLSLCLGASTGKPGSLYEETRYFNLAFMSYDGDQWTVQRLFPNFSWSSVGIYISGRIYTIARARNRDQRTPVLPHYFEIHFFQKFDLPYTDYIDTTTATESTRSLQAAKFESASGTFDVREDDGELIIAISADAPFPDNFHMRIMEALTYVTASQALWRATYTVDDTQEVFRLFSPMFGPQRSTRLLRPIHRAGLRDGRMFWRLFCKYLEFSVQGAPKRGWHPSFVHIHNAIEASANSLDAAAVGLCVAVEGLAEMIPIENDPTYKANCKKLVAHVKAFLQEMLWMDQSIGDRSLGSLSRLHIPRVKDRLATLIERGTIDEELVKIWGKLRHPSAHGAVLDIEAVEKEEMQMRWDNINSVTTLMYEITFHLIGYIEGYTDYSKPGWPTSRVAEK